MFRGILRAGTVCAAAVLLLATAAASAGAAGRPESLSDLIRAGNRDAVLAAITSPDLDVNAPGPDGSTALMWATYAADHELVRALLKRGARANVNNRYGASPLREAVKLSDPVLVRMLLDAHADANAANPDGETALMLAANLGATEIARMLLAHGANVNAVEAFRGQTALMWAAAENHPDVVDLLLAHHADVRLRARSDDWLRQVTSEPRAQFRQTGGLTALLYATREGCYGCVASLVKAGADVNQANPDGVTPLINAIDNRNYDVAMLLLDRGANPSAWDMTGRTPLYLAVDMHSLAPRVYVNVSGFAGYGEPTTLHGPNKATAMDLVNRLLDLGVDPGHELTRMRPNGNGRIRFEEYMMRGGATAVLVAAMAGDTEALKALIAHHAEVDVPNVFQITPLMAAASMSGSGRGNFGRPPQGDVQARALAAIDLLLDAGAAINTRVTNSHTHTARLVAYVQGRDHEGQTALFAAAESGWDRVVKRLLERGADATVHDAAGKTALDYARTPPPAGPGGAGAPPGGFAGGAAAARAATVALLAPLTPQSHAEAGRAVGGRAEAGGAGVAGGRAEK